MKWILALFLVVSLIGCASIRGDLIQLSQEDLANAEASRTIAKNLLLTWNLNSGFVRGALGDRLNQLPAEAVKAMDELDSLAGKIEWTDNELGRSLGFRVRLLGEVVTNALKLYAPEVLKYLSLAF